MDFRSRLALLWIPRIRCASSFGTGGICCVSVGTSEAVGGGATADAVSFAVTCGGISRVGCASSFGAGGICCVSVGTSEAVGGGATADVVSLAVTCGGGAVFVWACLCCASFKLAFSRRSFFTSRCVSTS